jgi:hypothetical protein
MKLSGNANEWFRNESPWAHAGDQSTDVRTKSFIYGQALSKDKQQLKAERGGNSFMSE